MNSFMLASCVILLHVAGRQSRNNLMSARSHESGGAATHWVDTQSSDIKYQWSSRKPQEGPSGQVVNRFKKFGNVF